MARPPTPNAAASAATSKNTAAWTPSAWSRSWTNSSPSPVKGRNNQRLKYMEAHKLKHGQAYDCTMDGNLGIEKTTIVPLAADPKTRQRLSIIGGRQARKGRPEFFRRL